jgi:hypothetical protein
MAGRADNVRGMNLGRSIDESCHRLQHFGIGSSVVSFGIGFVFPQTDCSHVDSAGTGKCYFVSEAVLPTKESILDFRRIETLRANIGNLLKVGVAKK